MLAFHSFFRTPSDLLFDIRTPVLWNATELFTIKNSIRSFIVTYSNKILFDFMFAAIFPNLIVFDLALLGNKILNIYSWAIGKVN